MNYDVGKQYEQTSQWLSLAMCFRSAIIWVLASDNTIGWESWWFFICSCRQSTIDLLNVVGKTLFLYSLCSHGKHYLVKFGFLFYLWSNVKRKHVHKLKKIIMNNVKWLVQSYLVTSWLPVVSQYWFLRFLHTMWITWSEIVSWNTE